MTKDRAQYILANTGRHDTLKWAFPSPIEAPPYFTGSNPLRTPICEDGITPAEWIYIKALWDFMPDNFSVHNVIEQIAKGV